MSIKYLYSDWFGKDRPLRHYTQHLIIGLLVFIFLSLLFKTWNGTLLLLTIIGTYVIDLDGLIYFLINFHRLHFASELVGAIKAFEMKRAASIATVHHKEMKGLYVHNVIGASLIFILFLYTLLIRDLPISYFLAGVVGHLAMDVFDDYRQIGHVNNWTWPLTKYPEPSPKH